MLFKRKLRLKKTHDHCSERHPRLTVVMIHGIATDSRCYHKALKYLEGTMSLQSIRFVTFDLLGSGKSRGSDRFNYDFDEQLTALHNSILRLKVRTPLVLVGHSMGTFIVTRYASMHKGSVQQLILLAPPVYTEKDLASREFNLAMEGFRHALGAKDRRVLKTKAFNNSMKNIVQDKNNYKTLANLKVPATLIYGEKDAIIASFNLKKLLKENPKYLTMIKTRDAHGISHQKYGKMVPILEEALNAETI